MTDAMAALERMRSAWQKTQDQQVLDLDPADPGLDETRATSPIPPPGGRARLVEPDGSSGSGASPTPAEGSESIPLGGGSSFRQGACEAAASRVPGSRHLHVVPDPRVPTPIPLTRLLEVLSWKP